MKLKNPANLFWIIIVSAFAFSFAFALTTQISDPDLFWHLATGKWIWEYKAIPTIDPFSFTVDKTVYEQFPMTINAILRGYWLGQLIYFGSYLCGNYWGIIVLRMVIYGLIVAVVTLWLRESGLSRTSIILFLMPLAYVLLKYLGDRPGQFSLLFSVLSLYFIFQVRMDRKRGIFLLPVMLLWANLHRGYILIVAIIAIVMAFDMAAIIYRKAKKLPCPGYGRRMALYGLAILACAITPTGIEILYVFRETVPTTSNRIAELMSPFSQFALGKHYPLAIVVASSIVFIAAFMYGITKKYKDLPLYGAIFLFLLALSLTAHRHVPFLPLLSGPLAVILGKDYLEQMNPVLKRGVLCLALIIFAVHAKSLGRPFNSSAPLINSHYPQNLISYIKSSNISGNIFNSYDIGGYLIWRLSPEIKVFIDNRGLVPEVFKEYLAVNSGSLEYSYGLPQWKAILQKNNIQYIVLTPLNRYGSMPPLVMRLHEDPEWKLLYFDLGSGTLLYARAAFVAAEYPKQFAYSRMFANATLLKAAIPGNGNIYVTLAQLYLLMDRKTEAIGLLEDAIRHYPSFGNDGPGYLLHDILNP